MSIRVIKPGLQTSFQDAGRKGQMSNGIAISGAMDPLAMNLANWLVGNPADHPVIEVTLLGPTLKFEHAMSIAVVGAEFDLYLNGNLVFNNETILVKKNDLLEFDKLINGTRAYLAVTGMPEIPRILNSYSTNLTAHFGGQLFKKNDIIKLTKTSIQPKKSLPKKFHRVFSGHYLIRCVSCVESDWFDKTATEKFFSQKYQVTPESNRMGIRLTGSPICTHITEPVLSSGLTQGSVQIPPSGQPIISSVDGQTIGGYPRIASITTIDQPVLGQIKAGDRLSFILISQTEAIELLALRHQFFGQLYAQI
ncbi:biotin-dependent carboxyltransferase family protein [Aliikangiella sp. IMCC44359]|uniref:biotin-dependent carboxyltransferase family protein n=1 Tax=Aliikangiella sp. IMCC44359 TaxID=3459125 RepID=UPI00403ACC46